MNVTSSNLSLEEFLKRSPDRCKWVNGELEFLYQNEIANPVFIGGDIHSFWVSNLKRDFEDPNSEIVASEFVTSSINS